MPDRNTLRQPYSQVTSQSQLTSAVKSVLASIDGVSIQDESDPDTLVVQAASNTWSRAARRKAKPQSPQLPLEPTLRCRIVCSVNLALEFTWIAGRERHTFESFYSHVNRKVGNIL